MNMLQSITDDCYRITLVNVPQSDPTQMSIAIPALTSFMRTNGYRSTNALDCNIGAYNYFLSKERLIQAADYIRKQLLILDRKRVRNNKTIQLSNKLSKSLIFSEKVINEIEAALDVLRSPRDFYNFETYWNAIDIINHALQMISAEYNLWNWSIFSCDSPGDKHLLTNLIKVVEDFENNPFVEYYRSEVLPLLDNNRCDLLGISMVYRSQLIPGLALAALAKQQNPKLNVVAGGNSISRITQALTGSTSWLPFTDFIVYSEGEHALLQLVKSLELGGGEFEGVPNLRYMSNKQGKVIETDLYIEDLDSHPTPDFTDLPLETYLSPTPVVTLDVTRGCYWGKCAFCSYGVSDRILKAYRERSLDKIVEDMRTLDNVFGVNNYLFSVDVLSPAFVKKLSLRLIEEGLSIKWMGDMRLESTIDKHLTELMYLSGCRFISSGLETASQRVQNWMNKGTNQSEASRILRSFRSSGIGINIQFFLGFPTETKEEAYITLDFVKSQHDSINTIGFGTFQLLSGAAVEKIPSQFGISRIYRGAKGNLSPFFHYKSISGVTNKEAIQIIDVEKAKLADIFPLFTNMSLLIGAHGLLYLAQFGPERFDLLLRGKHKYN